MFTVNGLSALEVALALASAHQVSCDLSTAPALRFAEVMSAKTATITCFVDVKSCS